MFSQTMPRDRFLEIMRFLRFDFKTERRNLLRGKFVLVSHLWNTFVDNCQKAFIPRCNITVDEQLLPCQARCEFIQYMANKLDKFGLTFLLAVDVEKNSFSMVFLMLSRTKWETHMSVYQQMHF